MMRQLAASLIGGGSHNCHQLPSPRLHEDDDIVTSMWLGQGDEPQGSPAGKKVV